MSARSAGKRIVFATQKVDPIPDIIRFGMAYLMAQKTLDAGGLRKIVKAGTIRQVNTLGEVLYDGFHGGLN